MSRTVQGKCFVCGRMRKCRIITRKGRRFLLCRKHWLAMMGRGRWRPQENDL